MAGKFLTYRMLVLSLCILLVPLFLFRPKHEPNLEVVPQNALEARPVGFPESVQALLHAQRFDDLDRMASEYRLKQSRFLGGQWKLSAFYNALGDYDHDLVGVFEERLAELKH